MALERGWVGAGAGGRGEKRFSHCIQSHHKTEKACTGLGFEKGIEFIKIENGGSS